MGHHGEEAILSVGNAEVGIHGGVGGAIPKNDNVAGEPDDASGGNGGVGWLERVIPLCPYVLCLLFAGKDAVGMGILVCRVEKKTSMPSNNFAIPWHEFP